MFMKRDEHSSPAQTSEREEEVGAEERRADAGRVTDA